MHLLYLKGITATLDHVPIELVPKGQGGEFGTRKLCQLLQSVLRRTLKANDLEQVRSGQALRDHDITWEIFPRTIRDMEEDAAQHDLQG